MPNDVLHGAVPGELDVVNAAEKTLTTNPLAAPVSEQSSAGMTPPQSAAG